MLLCFCWGFFPGSFLLCVHINCRGTWAAMHCESSASLSFNDLCLFLFTAGQHEVIRLKINQTDHIARVICTCAVSPLGWSNNSKNKMENFSLLFSSIQKNRLLIPQKYFLFRQWYSAAIFPANWFLIAKADQKSCVLSSCFKRLCRAVLVAAFSGTYTTK